MYQQLEPGKHQNITTATTTTISTKDTTLLRVVFNKQTTGAVTIYDSATATGIKISTIAIGAVGVYEFNCKCRTGLTVVTAQADDLTVITV